MLSTGSLEERLERGEVVHFPAAPFALPCGDDLIFLCGQTLRSRRDKNISYNPATGHVNGFHWQGQRLPAPIRRAGRPAA